MNTLNLKPATGLKVIDPETRRALPVDGDEVRCISRNGLDWQPIQQKSAIGTYKEWCSSCFDPYAAGFDNNGIVDFIKN